MKNSERRRQQWSLTTCSSEKYQLQDDEPGEPSDY
jgi:hypothetical protein